MSTRYEFVSDVLDGDTFVTSSGDRVRIADINAPELAQPGGRAAWQALRALILGRMVTIQSRARDVFGRLVADVYVNGQNVADALRASGVV